MNKIIFLTAVSVSALKFNSGSPPQMMAQFDEEVPKAFVNYTNMTTAELGEMYDLSEKDFNEAFKTASDKLNKTKKYDEAGISALVKSEVKLTELIEGFRSNLIASGAIESKKYSIEELSKVKASEDITKYIDALKNAQATVPSQKAIYDLVHVDMF